MYTYVCVYIYTHTTRHHCHDTRSTQHTQTNDLLEYLVAAKRHPSHAVYKRSSGRHSAHHSESMYSLIAQ